MFEVVFCYIVLFDAKIDLKKCSFEQGEAKHCGFNYITARTES